MTKTRRFAVASICAAVACGAALRAQETRSDTLLTTEHWLDWERVSDAQISPDGSRIVYTRQFVNKLEDKWESNLWILNADGSQHRFLVKGGSARWSPDGKRLMYLAEGEPKGSQLFVRWVDADGPATQITHVVEAPRGAKWSPDGKSIAFSMFVADAEKWSISMPTEPKGAKWTPAPRVVGTIHYRQDQVGYLEDGFTHLFVIPAEGGTARELTTGKWSVGAGELRGAASIDWTPDSKSIVGGVKPVTVGKHMLTFDSMSKDLIVAGTSADLDHPQDVVRVNLKAPGQVVKLTDVNGDVLQGKQLAKIEEVNYTSTGNARVQGWIVKPPRFDPSKKYPLILEIHGGPFGNYNVGFNYMFQNFAANGFVVLYINPRGSTGYGTDFINGIDHN